MKIGLSIIAQPISDSEVAETLYSQMLKDQSYSILQHACVDAYGFLFYVIGEEKDLIETIASFLKEVSDHVWEQCQPYGMPFSFLRDSIIKGLKENSDSMYYIEGSYPGMIIFNFIEKDANHIRRSTLSYLLQK